jgi:hypothetical protein
VNVKVLFGFGGKNAAGTDEWSVRKLKRTGVELNRNEAFGYALRAAMWRQWKTPRRRREALIELGVRPRLASNTAGSGLGPWYLAKAKALSVGLSNAYFKSLGLPSLIDE